MRSEHEGAGDQSPGETCQSAPLKRAEEAESWTLRLPVDWIRFDEQPYPRAIKRRIDHAKNEPVKDVTNQCSKQLGRRIHGPVQWHPPAQRKKRERPGEPPKDCVTQTPTHAGAVAANVALEEQTKCCANDEGHTELQR